MKIFAWKNLLTRPLRTVLALVGLSIPILGVMGLFSLSGGLKNLVGDTLSKVQGVMVLRENSPSPVFSDLKADVADAIRRIPGVERVAPEVWKVAPNIEKRTLFGGVLMGKGVESILDQPVVQGQDIVAHQHLQSAVYPRAIKEGRFLAPADKGSRNIIISRKIAKDYPIDKHPRRLGDTLHIGNKAFTIVGIYETGSMLLDVVIVMDIDTARSLFSI